MIRGVGIDVVEVRRVRAVYRRFGARLAARLLHPGELKELASLRRAAHFLARRLAAKEALVKALGTGIGGGITFSQIRVCHEPGKQPFLCCRGRAEERMRALGTLRCHLSLTDERDYAVACVVLESAD